MSAAADTGKKNFPVIFKISGSEEIHFSAPEGITVLEAAKRAGIAIDAPCSGNGSCGKCLVRITSGKTENSATGHISSERCSQGWRLACQTKIEDALTLTVPEGASTFKSRMRITDFSDSRERGLFEKLKAEMESLGFSGGSGLELVHLKLARPGTDDPMADRERLLAALAGCMHGAPGDAEFDIDLCALRKLPGLLRHGDFSSVCVVKHEKNRIVIIDVFDPGKEPKGKTGKAVLPALAVDIGTTTVALVITDVLSGEILAMGSEGNGQIRYGADVINRIIESAREGGLERLRRAVLEDTIIPLLNKAAAAAGIESSQIYRTAIAGNTTMTHLFAGVPPEYLRLEPYVPAFFHGGPWRPGDLGLPVHPGGDVLIAPSVGSYVGGDISAGTFASMIARKGQGHCSLFIDLGTNGELVLGGGDWLMTCACSAGPAFEGGDITWGMRATVGAVEACKVETETMEPALTVIGGGKPAGICGSGLIDLVGELFAAGVIDARGKISLAGGSRLRRDKWGMGSYVLAFENETESGEAVILTEGDIDNFIRAKGAIFSAIRTMLAMVDLRVEAVEDVYIAGGIGSGINIAQAVRIGMLPAIPPERYHYIGNTSLSGAWAMAQSEKAAGEVARIAGGMTYLELSSHPHYMDEFIAACFLPHTDGKLFK
jgi:uncharacterized 2Fe-2S/4Fe-4S cluster protein (DUF4445 family)